MARVTLVLFSLLALYIHQGLGIECFVCSSDFEPRCADPFNVTKHRYMIEDCDRGRSSSSYLRGKAYCKKYKHFDNGQKIVVRSCFWKNENEDPCSPATVNPRARLEECSACDTDECNAASSIVATFFVFPLAIFAYKFL